MLNYTPALPKETFIQDLQMKEISPIMKLIVRGKKREFISAVGKSLNILLPTEANTSTQSNKLTALWLSYYKIIFLKLILVLSQMSQINL